MKRVIALLMACVFVMTMVLTGCSGTDKPTPPANTEPKKQETTKAESGMETGKKTTLNFWTFQELHKGFMDDAVDSWNKANADKQIELKTDVYPYDENHNKLLIALQSGTGAPDIADIEISKFPQFS